MSRSKYVSVGDTGGLILDGKYDDFATNAGLQIVKNEIVSAIEASNVQPISFVKRPKTHLHYQQNTDRSGSYRPFVSYYKGRDYGVDHGWICYTTDGWETKTTGIRANLVSNGLPVAGVAWEDGSMCVVGRNGDIYTLSDLEDDSPVVTLEGLKFVNFNVDFYSDGINRYVLAGEYTSGEEQNNLYLSVDGGHTFSVIKTTITRNPGGNNHWHAVKYDPYSGAIWACQGDGANAGIFFSYDLGETWHEVDYQGERHQPTLVMPFPDRVVFGEDSSTQTPGLFEYIRAEPRETVTLQRALEFRTDKRANHYYPQPSKTAIFDSNTAYVLFSDTVGDPDLSYIYATGDGGNTWHLVKVSHRHLWILGQTLSGELITVADGGWYKSKQIEWE